MLRATILAVAVAAFPATLPAQHPLVGRWAISFPGGMRVENGVPTVISRTGKLTVVTEGDSLVATLATDPAEGLPNRPDVRLATKPQGNDAVFVQRATARVNVNGNEREVTSVATWTLTAAGDKLTGTVLRKIEAPEAPPSEPQPVSGTRLPK